MATIGDRICHARTEKGATQEELAAAVGTSKQNIYKYEKGIVTNIPMDRVVRIAEYLGVAPAWLLGWHETVGSVLSDDERQLLAVYRSLNAQGQQLLLTTAQSFAGNPALQKDGAVKAI